MLVSPSVHCLLNDLCSQVCICIYSFTLLTPEFIPGLGYFSQEASNLYLSFSVSILHSLFLISANSDKEAMIKLKHQYTNHYVKFS